MIRYSITLLLLGLVFSASKELGESQEFSYNDADEVEPQVRSSFLSFDDESANNIGFDLDFDFDFNVSDILNTTAIIDTVQNMIEPIGEKIDAVGQQLDAAITWASSVNGEGLQETIQDVMKSIQEPIGQHIDAVLAWVGATDSNELTEAKPESREPLMQISEEEFSINIDEELLTDDTKTKEEVIMESETIIPEKKEDASITNEAPLEAEQPQTITVEEIKVVPLPVAPPVADIDEIVVLVNYDDILAAMNSPNATVEMIETEPFYVRFFEVFMGKEVEIGVGGASLSPVEESKKKSQFLSYDAL